MAYKDVLAIVTSAEQEGVLKAAALIGDRWGAHVAALHVAELPQPVSAPYGAGLWAELVTEARKQATAERKKIAARLEKLAVPVELRAAEAYPAVAEDAVAYHALHADLTLAERASEGLGRAVLEAALFKSGRPVLAIPPDWAGQSLGQRVLVAWSAKPQAARALADAAPFLEAAEAVTIVTVDAQPAPGATAPPGLDIATHLARRGVKVELRQIDGLGREAQDAILDEARALNADLIVMGGYGHSRLRQFVFGGVTRSLTQSSPIPLLLSH